MLTRLSSAALCWATPTIGDVPLDFDRRPHHSDYRHSIGNETQAVFAELEQPLPPKYWDGDANAVLQPPVCSKQCSEQVIR